MSSFRELNIGGMVGIIADRLREWKCLKIESKYILPRH